MKSTSLFLLLLCLTISFLSQAQNDTLTITGVGDIMMGTSYPTNRLPENDGRMLFHEVGPYLSRADLTFGNLEGTLLDEGGTPKTCKNPSVCYVFKSPTRYVNNLKAAGFDVVSLANNHAGDFGDVGRKSTMKALDGVGIEHAGQLQKPYTIILKDGIRYGMIAFAPNNNCVPLNDLVNARKLVQKVDSLADVVIVSFHGGAEGPQYQHVPRKSELFYGENRGNVYQFAHTVIDAGADIVFGHGPHVTRAIEIYKGRFITYSMGNFCTYQGINVQGVNGLAPIMEIKTNREGKFLTGKIIPTYQTYGSNVQIDSEKRVIKKIQELTKKDFPETRIEIADTGIIHYLAQ